MEVIGSINIQNRGRDGGISCYNSEANGPIGGLQIILGK